MEEELRGKDEKLKYRPKIQVDGRRHAKELGQLKKAAGVWVKTLDKEKDRQE